MPVECVPSNLESDIRCAVCGQGFLLFSKRVTQHQRAAMRTLVQHALRRHHREVHSGDHPQCGFTVELAVNTPMPALV